MAIPGVEEIIVLKGAQVGWSELCRNILGYWIDLSPGPTLILMPDQKSAEAFSEERLAPLMKHTKAVSRHISGRAWDVQKHRVKFDTMSVFLAWAGSKSGTKSRPIRFLIGEEPDEYPAFSGKGGDPISKAQKRLTTFQDKGLSRTLIGGTPTTRKGNVWKLWELCPVRYQLWVPCPHCNGYQLLAWKSVRWPKLENEPERAKRVQQIRERDLAYYECEHCQQQIKDHHKPRMLRRGIWAGEDQVVTRDGRVVGPQPKAKRIGFKLPSYYSPWVGFSKLAGEWIEAQDDPEALADFINQRLAEPFEEQRARIEPTAIQEKAAGSPSPMLVPKWARALIATADTQGNDEHDGWFPYCIRAWGFGYRSQLVDYGICHSKDELRQRCLGRLIPMDGGQPVAPQMLFVDSGGPRWSEIYQFALSDVRIHPTKGLANSRTWMVDEKPQRRHGVVLWEVDTEQAKDLLYRLIHDPDRGLWLPHSQVNDDYCRQMTSEAKIYDPSDHREKWTEIIKKQNHFWDCEALQVAAAWRMGMGTPEPPAPTQSATPADRSEFNPAAYKGRW